MIRRRRCRGFWDLGVWCLLAVAAIVALFLIPAVVWLIALGILGGIGLVYLFRLC